MILQFSFDVEDEYFGSFKDTSALAKNQTRILSVSLKVGSRRRRIGEESTTKRFLALLNTDIIQLNSHRLLFTKEAITSISSTYTGTYVYFNTSILSIYDSPFHLPSFIIDCH